MKNLGQVLLVCLAIVASVMIAANAFLQRNEGARSVSVTGSTRVDFVSDLIVWSGQFTRKAPELQAAFAKLGEDRALIREYLLGKGVSEPEIVFSAIDIQKENEPVFSGGNRVGTRFVGYVLSQELRIESHDVDRIESISREVTELINRGIEFASYDPRYYYTKLAELKVQMIEGATKDGRQRAEQIAKTAGARLSALKSASLGVFQITAPNSSEEITWEGAYNTTSKRKTGLVTVRLQFRVK